MIGALNTDDVPYRYTDDVGPIQVHKIFVSTIQVNRRCGPYTGLARSISRVVTNIS